MQYGFLTSNVDLDAFTFITVDAGTLTLPVFARLLTT